MFTVSPDGQQIWAVYHAKQYTYTAYTMRRLYTQPLTWVDNFPYIEDPQPVDTIFTFTMNAKTIESRISGFGATGVLDYTPSTPIHDAEFDDVAPFVDMPTVIPPVVDQASNSLFLVLIISGAAVALTAIGVTVGIIIKKKKSKKADQ